MSAPLYVRGAAAWHGERARPAAALMPPRMRGRASPLTAMLAQVVQEATHGAGVDPATLPSVFGSAYGEMATTGALLAQLWAAGGALSPAKFQASVHNTAAAQLSIALHNPRFTTSIAAGYDTVAMSLVEAAAWLARHPGQVLVACADEAPSAELQPGVDYPPLAAAFVLDNVSGPGLARLELLSELNVEPGAKPRENPVAGAVRLASAVLAARRTTVTLHAGYAVRVEPGLPDETIAKEREA